MRLLYFETAEPSSVASIVLPFGVKKCKIRAGAGTLPVTGLGVVSAGAFNTLGDYTFPIINGLSPNTFTFNNTSTTATQLYVLVEELGGLPDPDYFNREVEPY